MLNMLYIYVEILAPEKGRANCKPRRMKMKIAIPIARGELVRERQKAKDKTIPFVLPFFPAPSTTS